MTQGKYVLRCKHAVERSTQHSNEWTDSNSHSHPHRPVQKLIKLCATEGNTAVCACMSKSDASMHEMYDCITTNQSIRSNRKYVMAYLCMSCFHPAQHWCRTRQSLHWQCIQSQPHWCRTATQAPPSILIGYHLALQRITVWWTTTTWHDKIRIIQYSSTWGETQPIITMHTYLGSQSRPKLKT